MSNAEAPWVQLTLHPNGYEVDALEDALLAAGAVAVTLSDGGQDPVLELAPGETRLWRTTLVTGLFDARTLDIPAAQATICRELDTRIMPSHRLDPLEDRDWVRAWMDDYHSMRFGRRLWVCPSHRSPPTGGAAVVHLDPGLAFGTGTHPTTALCLEWLDGFPVEGTTVLDYGCGSGILAIAAGVLGARELWATDIDPQALDATLGNARRNGLQDHLSVTAPENLPEGLCVDVVLANILAGPLVALAPRLAPRVRGGGVLVMSGLLERHADEIEHAYARWFDFSSRRLQDGWVLLEAIRRHDEPTV